MFFTHRGDRIDIICAGVFLANVLLLEIYIKMREVLQAMKSEATEVTALDTAVQSLQDTVAAETSTINTQTESINAEHTAIVALIAEFPNPTEDQAAVLQKINDAISNAKAATATVANSVVTINADADAVKAATPAPDAPVLTATATTVTTPSTTVTAGANISLTISVEENPVGIAPSGTVEVFEDTTSLGTVTLGAEGIADFTIGSITAGTHVYSATYSGDAANGGSNSDALTVIAS